MTNEMRLTDSQIKFLMQAGITFEYIPEFAKPVTKKKKNGSNRKK